MKTKIEWCDYTFNPWIGCSRVSPGCANCYAEGIAKRFKLAEWGKSAERILSSDKYFNLPLQWDRKAAKNKTRYKVFCASMADVFDEKVPWQWKVKLFNMIRKTNNLDWLILTKRPHNAKAFFNSFQIHSYEKESFYRKIWLGVSIENQKAAEERIPVLLQIPAAKRFLSMEPLLGDVDLENICEDFGDDLGDGAIYLNALTGERYMQDGIEKEQNSYSRIDWVIVGGESGRNARPMNPDWVRSLRDQCVEAEVPFFFKQWGEWVAVNFTFWGTGVQVNSNLKKHCFPFSEDENHGTFVAKVGRGKAGRILDGREWNEFPGENDGTV